jgi:outer membrane protein, heavy metal efflux system
MMHRIKFVLTFFLAGSALAQPSFDLAQLENMAMESSRAVLAARDGLAAARAAVDSAAAFPNPEIEYLSGSARARGAAGNDGSARTATLTQPLDLPWQRVPRVAAAEAAAGASSATLRAFEADFLARLRIRYFEVLRRQAELKNSLEDKELMESVRSRIEMRVKVGEAPRFELIKADAETLNAQKVAQAAAFRVEQARSLLRQAVGQSLPADFAVEGSLGNGRDVPPLEQLRTQMVSNNPEIERARAELVRAERQLELERNRRWPSVALKASRDEDPDIRISTVGVVLSVPLWDRRRGPIGEAAAQLSRARNELAEQDFSLGQTLEVAFQQYEIAQAQVTALESGIVRQAESALKVAESAYRFGERGFLEVLDAQRVYRAARAELINARFELAAAWVDIERLRVAPGNRKL